MRPRRIRTPVTFFKRRSAATRRVFHAHIGNFRAGFRKPVALAGTLLVLACGSSVPPELGNTPSGLRVNLETRYYDIGGMSAKDLEVAMVMHGPEVEGHPRYAATSFQIRWSFTVRGSPAGCVVQTPRIELTMTEYLPRWTDRDRGDDHLRASWDGFFEAVRTHERGHQQRNVDGAERMLRALRDAHSAGGCPDLRNSTDIRMQELLTQVHADNHRYDLETSGGARVGVRWPPPR